MEHRRRQAPWRARQPRRCWPRSRRSCRAQLDAIEADVLDVPEVARPGVPARQRPPLSGHERIKRPTTKSVRDLHDVSLSIPLVLFIHPLVTLSIPLWGHPIHPSACHPEAAAEGSGVARASSYHSFARSSPYGFAEHRHVWPWPDSSPRGHTNERRPPRSLQR